MTCYDIGDGIQCLCGLVQPKRSDTKTLYSCSDISIESRGYQVPKKVACTCKRPGCRSGAESSARSCDQSISVADPSFEPAQTRDTAADLARMLAEQSGKIESLSQQLTSKENATVQSTQLVSLRPILTYTDMDLVNHFYTSTLPTLSVGDEPGRQYWTNCLSNLGYQYPHLYHLILALAALHKARLHSHQRAELLVQAERHHAVGVQGSTAVLGSINDDNYEVVRTSASLIGLINVAMGPRPGEYIAFSEKAGPNFLDMLRWSRSIRRHEHYNATQEKSPTDTSIPSTGSDVSAESPFANDPKAHLRKLYTRVREIPEARHRKSYIRALDDLEQFFVVLDGHLGSSSGSARPDAAHHLRPLGWIYRMQYDFLEWLQNKEPLALVIVAYFAVVFKELESGWPADWWAEHIMPKICEEVVERDDRELLRWPMVWLKGTTREGMAA